MEKKLYKFEVRKHTLKMLTREEWMSSGMPRLERQVEVQVPGANPCDMFPWIPAWYRNELGDLVAAQRECSNDSVVYRTYVPEFNDTGRAYVTEDYLKSRRMSVVEFIAQYRYIEKVEIELPEEYKAK